MENETRGTKFPVDSFVVFWTRISSYETTHILVHAAIRKMSIGYSIDHEECERPNDSANVVVVVHFKLQNLSYDID